MSIKTEIPRHIDSDTFENIILPGVDNRDARDLLLRIYKKNSAGNEYFLLPGVPDDDCRRIRDILKRIGMVIETGGGLTRKDALKRIAMGISGAVLFPGIIRSEHLRPREDLLAYYRVYYSYYYSRYYSNYMSYSSYNSYSSYFSQYDSSYSSYYNNPYNKNSDNTYQSYGSNSSRKYKGTLYFWGGTYTGEIDKVYKNAMGFGVWYNAKTGEKYTGQWNNGQPWGHGVHIKPNGERFEGYFERNRQHGYGILYDKNGKIIKKGRWYQDRYMGPN